jgi:hypothetical protein
MGFQGFWKVERPWTWRRSALGFLIILGCASPALVSGRPVRYWSAVVLLSVVAVVGVWRIWRDRNSSVGSIDQPDVPEFPRPGVWVYVVFFAAVILGRC